MKVDFKNWARKQMLEMTQGEAMNVLQLSDMDRQNINKNYRMLSQKFHPDKMGGDVSQMKKINQAFSILTGKEKPTPEKPVPEKSEQQIVMDYLNKWNELRSVLSNKIGSIFTNCREYAEGRDLKNHQTNIEAFEFTKKKFEDGIQAITNNKLKKWNNKQFLSKRYVDFLRHMDSTFDKSKSELTSLYQSSNATVDGQDKIGQCYRMIMQIHQYIRQFLDTIDQYQVQEL